MLKRISVFALVSVMGLSLAACSANEQRTAGYGTGGAALGALAGAALNKHDRGRGALAGAAIGGIGGTAVGAMTSKRNGVQYCNYRDNSGRTYEAPCQNY